MDKGLAPYADIEAELNKRGLGAAQKATPNRIGAVTALARIYNGYGLERLGVTTDVLTAAFTRTSETWNGDMLQAVAKLISEKEVRAGRIIKSNAAVVDIKRLVKVLGAHSIAQWATLSLTGSGGSESRSNAIARTIAGNYNHRQPDTKKLYLPAPITRVP
jgi:hypothetical protein